jgi:hypothetical protein
VLFSIGEYGNKITEIFEIFTITIELQEDRQRIASEK